jgi:predicted exporter
MTRLVIPIITLGILLTLIVVLVNVRSDVEDMLGPGVGTITSLDSAAGRELVLALENSDLAKRNAAARDIATMLATDPQVANVLTGPEAVSDDFLEWIWRHRFQLSPPASEDLTIESLSQRLSQARDILGRADGMLIGDRLLRDPTGSFANLLERRSNMEGMPAVLGGIWQARDNSAAILFVTLADQAFEIDSTAALAGRIRARATQQGVKIHLLGPRIIAAEISANTSRAAGFAGLVATALLLIWLAWILRSGRRLLSTFLPLAMGVATATLMVQLIFGSVHVITLGFGGVLAGLALDYSLHVLAHGPKMRRQAERLIMIGAMTTAAGFLALLGSGVEVLMQTGLFVGVGLAVAAVTSGPIVATSAFNLRAPHLERLVWHLPFKPQVEIFLILAGVIFVAMAPTRSPQALFESPGNVEAVISKFAELVELPSGQHVLAVNGQNLEELLAREAILRGVLDRAIADNLLDRYGMLAQLINPNASDTIENLPDHREFRERVSVALLANSMEGGFSEIQTNAYRAARDTRSITLEDLSLFAETQRLRTGIVTTANSRQETVRLFGLRKPNLLADRIAQAGIPGIQFVDIRARIDAEMRQLRERVALWLGLGAILAFVVLSLGLRDRRRTIAIARTTAAAACTTAALLILVGGTVGILQIVALTLVVGIGIDYGLFLTRTSAVKNPESDRDRFRSVALCAGSTLIAFSVMSIAPIRILHEIGLTVSLGVVVMVVLNLARTGSQE